MRKIAMRMGVALCAVVVCAASHALRPKDDFFVHIKNETSGALDICNTSLSFCKTLKAGEVFTDAQATNGQGDEYLTRWLGSAKARFCGKTVALKDLVVLNQKSQERGAAVYRFNIARQAEGNGCGKA